MADPEEILQTGLDNPEWDRAVLHSSSVGRAGCDGDYVLYRPGRLVLDERALADDSGGRLRRLLDDNGAVQADEPLCGVAGELGLALYNAPDDRLVELVARAREIAPQAAALDHVLGAGPQRRIGDGEPEPVEDPGTVPGAGELGAGITVAVLDTGIADDFPVDVDGGPGDREVPDEDADGRRDPAAGHGTHVAGIVLSVAPCARIVARRVLRTGVGEASELEVAEALLAAREADVVNCSFSGPSLHDAPPLVIERALARLRPQTVVVAGAGNRGTDRPQWPAASKRVIAVGAIGRRSRGGPWLRTEFTDFGPWVDCCAPGVDVPSAFLRWSDSAGSAPREFKGWARWSGCSMATPYVAGAIAALATRDRIDVALAVHRLVRDPARPRLAQLGAIVDPAALP